MLRRILIPIALALSFATPVWADDDAGTAAPVATVDAGTDATTASGLPTKADELPNPATSPKEALSDAKLARKTSWPLAVWAVLAMLGKLLAYGQVRFKSTPLVGKLATWLATGKRAMIVAAIGAVGAAGYNTLIDGGTLVAALVASGVAIAGLTHSTTHTAAAAKATATASGTPPS